MAFQPDTRFKPKPLQWSSDSLSPFLSAKSVNHHYDNFYQRYVDQMNTLAQEYPELQNLTLAQIVDQYQGKFQNVAAQILNHEFFFENISPSGGNPGARTYQMISDQFGSFEKFKLEFNQTVINHFGSGWVWLVYNPTTHFLSIVDGQDAYNPIMNGFIGLLAIDVWEHSYFDDYLSDRKNYVERFWDFVNWAMVDKIVSEEIAGDNFRVYV